MNSKNPPHKFVDRHFTAPPGKVGLLYGERKVYSLATLIAVEILLRDPAIVIIDAANRVDPYLFAKLARMKDIDPYSFLDRTFVTRAYTCYQLDISITDGLFQYVCGVNAQFVIVYGLIDLFDDEQVPIADVVDILRRTREALLLLKSKGISTLLVSSTPRFRLKEREQFFSHLTAMADVRYRLEQHNFDQHIILEENTHGKNNADRNNAYSVRREQLVTIPTGVTERRPKRI
jgi:hypothetical protein